MKNTKPVFGAYFISDDVWRFIPEALRDHARELTEIGGRSSTGGVIVCLASEMLAGGIERLPRWVSRLDTRFLVYLDIPAELIMGIPAMLALRKPDQRLHVTSDKDAIARFLISQFRESPIHGIVNARVFKETLFLLVGDLIQRAFPISRVSKLSQMSEEELSEFRVSSSGSFLSWPSHDLDLGVPGLLKLTDPTYFAELEIERARSDLSGDAIRLMREERGLSQADIDGLSERQVRRIEKGESSLTLESAKKLSNSLDLSMVDFLDEIALYSGNPKEWLERRKRRAS